MPEAEILNKPDATGPRPSSRFRMRERTANSLTRLAKVFGGTVPPDIAAAEAAAGMDSTTPFSPGAPLTPYDGYSRTPRQQNFTPQHNVSARPRSHERVSFDALRGLIDSYDIAQIAIWHRIDSIRALEWSLVAADGYEGDVSDAVALGMSVLRKPDGKTPFGAWLGAWLYDVLAYDAGALYRMRNRAGRTVGLKYVDGTTLAPLLSDWGDVPEAPAPAFVQYVNGLPWNWLTTDDVIYQPFRKVTGSPYGRSPIESIILNANTDLRTQAYFLQRYTEGNLPAAFASAPETWTPQQIEQFQEYWDAFLLGDQAFKAQVRWIPPGSKIEWSNEKDFSDGHSLHMLRKTFAAYHVVPSDAGFTQEINKSSGETQSDVQHRLGDVPLAKHIDGIFTSFLQEDLALPIKFQFDFGEEQDDRYQTAQADDLYIKNGTVSNSDIRELRFGLSEPEGKRTPRFIYSNRSGPVPLSALEAVAGPIDQESGAPEPGAPLPHTVFQPVEGVEGNPPTPRPPLAVEQYGPSALPVAAPQSVPALPPVPVRAELAPAPVAKDGEGAGAPTAGITTATGITSYDLIGQHDNEDEDDPETVAKELAAYRRFAKARRRDGKWRDFQFETLDAATARSLNNAGRHSVITKADGGTPGLTKRSGMISLDLPAGLVPTVPGGVPDHHITVVYLGKDLTDEEFDAACDRAETAAAQASGPLAGTIAGVDSFPPSAGSDGLVPAFVPVTLPGVDALHDALADLSASEHRDYTPHVTLKYCETDEPLPDPVAPTLVTFTHLTVHCGDETRSFPLGPRILGLAKAAAGEPGPKADASAKEASASWPGWDHDLHVANHWAQKLTDGYTAALSHAHAQRIAASFIAAHPQSKDEKRTKAETAALAATLLAAALAHLENQGLDFTGPATETLRGLYADAYLIGAASGDAVIDGDKPALTGWAPGKTDDAHRLIEGLALGAGLSALLLRAPETAAGMSNTRMAALASALAAGAAAGQSAAVIAGSLIAVLKAGWRSLTAAITAVTSGSGDGATDTYQRRGVELLRWALDPSVKNCAVCVDNADAAPRRFGQAWPSGDKSTPIHGRCRCQLVPA